MDRDRESSFHPRLRRLYQFLETLPLPDLLPRFSRDTTRRSSRPVTIPKVLAISSGGGHWVQLLRLRPAFDGCDVTFATVERGHQAEVNGAPFRVVPDAHRQARISALRSAVYIFFLLLQLRPDVVVTTGAAPGYFAIRFGKWLGARTIWVDSIANAEELSLSGQMAEGRADLWLTQWPHLERPNGPTFRGNVL